MDLTGFLVADPKATYVSQGLEYSLQISITGPCSMALAPHSLLRRPPFLHIPSPGGGGALLVSVTNSGVPLCTGIPGECPAGRASLPHSNSGRPRGYLAALNPGPTQPQRPQVVVGSGGGGLPFSRPLAADPSAG